MTPRPPRRVTPLAPPPKAKACKSCGHWSNSPEFGMDITTGYCEVWEKLTSATYLCDQFIEREQHKREQQEAFERMSEEGEDFDD